MLDLICSLDAEFILWVSENLRNPILSAIFITITKTGDAGFIFIVVGVLLLCFSRTRKTGAIFLLALSLNFILNDLILKEIFERPRPFQSLEMLSALIPAPPGYSFPSGHTSSAFSCLVTLFFTEKKIAPFALIYAVLMGFSRVYVGVHYPSDVIVGAIVGVVCAYLSVFISKAYKKQFKAV